MNTNWEQDELAKDRDVTITRDMQPSRSNELSLDQLVLLPAYGIDDPKDWVDTYNFEAHGKQYYLFDGNQGLGDPKYLETLRDCQVWLWRCQRIALVLNDQGKGYHMGFLKNGLQVYWQPIRQ